MAFQIILLPTPSSCILSTQIWLLFPVIAHYGRTQLSIYSVLLKTSKTGLKTEKKKKSSDLPLNISCHPLAWQSLFYLDIAINNEMMYDFHSCSLPSLHNQLYI